MKLPRWLEDSARSDDGRSHDGEDEEDEKAGDDVEGGVEEEEKAVEGNYDDVPLLLQNLVFASPCSPLPTLLRLLSPPPPPPIISPLGVLLIHARLFET